MSRPFGLFVPTAAIAVSPLSAAALPIELTGPGVSVEIPWGVQVVLFLFYGALAVFLAAWAVLLIACLRKRRFWPVFSTDKATKLFWLAALALLNPVLTVVYFIFGQLRRPDAPAGRRGRVMVRSAAIAFMVLGFLVTVPGLAHLWTASFIVTIFAENRVSCQAVSGSNWWPYGTFACRRIAIVHGNDGRLTPLIAGAVRDELVMLPYVEEVQLSPDGRFPPDGTVRPDLFVTVEVRSVRGKFLPHLLRRDLSAEIGFSVGSTPFRSAGTPLDQQGLPKLHLEMETAVDHASKTVGIESVRHGQAAANIAAAFVKELKGGLERHLDERGPTARLPAAFSADFRAAEIPAPLAELPNEHLGSYSSLFAHNESYWRLTAPAADLEVLFGRLAAGMTAAGWKSQWEERKGGTLLEMFKGNASIRLREQSRPYAGTGWRIVTGKDAEKPPEESPSAIIEVQYLEGFSPDEMGAAVDKLLESDAPIASSMFLAHAGGGWTQPRLVERLESRPTPWVPAFLQAAHFHPDRDTKPESMAAVLRKARAALRTLASPGEFSKLIDREAESLATMTRAGTPVMPKDALSQAPGPDDFRSAGFREVARDGAPVEFEVGVDEPAALFLTAPDGRILTVAITVIGPPAVSPSHAYAIRYVESDGSTRRSGYDRGGSSGKDRCRIRYPSASEESSIAGFSVELAQIEGKDRFRVTAR